MLPALAALCLLLLAAGATSALAGHRESRRRALQAGIDSLRFTAFVALIRQVMARRGFETACRLGTGENCGYEFEARRDGRTWLVACKLGASVRVTARHVHAIEHARADAAAAGAIVFASGDVDADAQALADGRGIEIVAGPAFRREIARVLGADTVANVRAHTRAGMLLSARRGLVAGLLVGAAGASAVAVAMHV